ncbi:MAG TPA: bifunctional 4-hydroxy-2-oxoglutarate aldolase/2-dehydro-3-deoxy-phosphogluconate aldolase [Steroidobacteraceae bacterium]|jgi:2-dehydro-3-deoxyphosphogluconate aldolase/(4S)-4-hydroxy-2-oxoglutarate aldolase|nr:bifunctional 4-hydroxy-2-oxoglutarate aldolase/2-dehydro-3-deoxy-phosphogluconate aldolase [Steroidobacteraceae bacterium]
MNIREIVGMARVIPVLTVSDAADAVLLARALVAGGLRVLEITLDTPVAAPCIEAIRGAVPEAIVGAGTLTRAVDFATAGRAGAQFGVSPGLTPELAGAARGARFPLLPGVMTPAEVIAARHAGFNILKLFPAQQAGGTGMLRALASLFPDVLFCPTGGITRANAQEYLALPNVICVGGSWIAPQEMLQSRDWPGVEALARDAAALKN